MQERAEGSTGQERRGSRTVQERAEGSTGQEGRRSRTAQVGSRRIGRSRRCGRTLEEKRARLGRMLLTPSLTGILLFYGIPLLDVVRRSFCDAMGKGFVGLANFWQLLGNQAFRLAFSNTMRYELICLPLLLVLSLLLALLVWKLREASGSCTALVLPLALPTASMVLVWQILLCRQGVLDQLLCKATGRLWERDWTSGPWAFWVLAATYLWKNTGYDSLLWLSGLHAVPQQLYEAARIDGAGCLDRFWYITLPCLKGTARLVLMLSLVNSFQVFREAFLLAGSYPDESIYLFQHLFNHWFVEMDVQKMCTAAALMVAAGGTACQSIRRLGRGWEHLRADAGKRGLR